MIDVLVPVLGRPQNAQPLVESFRAHSHPLDEITFLCSPWDFEQYVACIETGERVILMDFPPGPGDYARKMNYGFSMTERPWVLLGADDITFTAGWWEEALKQDASVIATNDHANAQVKRGQFGTHCLVRRSYIEDKGGSADGIGVLLHTGYDHNFVDRELCHLAQSRGEYAFAERSIVKHSHPLWKTAESDATYEKGLKNFIQDRNLFLDRAHLWNYVGLRAAERNQAQRRHGDIVAVR